MKTFCALNLKLCIYKFLIIAKLFYNWPKFETIYNREPSIVNVSFRSSLPWPILLLFSALFVQWSIKPKNPF